MTLHQAFSPKKVGQMWDNFLGCEGGKNGEVGEDQI
jgi:hypothetical protein